MVVEQSECPDAEQHPVTAETEEQDRRNGQRIDVQCVNVLPWAVGVGELEMSRQQCGDVTRTRVLSDDSIVVHQAMLTQHCLR